MAIPAASTAAHRTACRIVASRSAAAHQRRASCASTVATPPPACPTSRRLHTALPRGVRRAKPSVHLLISASRPTALARCRDAFRSALTAARRALLVPLPGRSRRHAYGHRAAAAPSQHGGTTAPYAASSVVRVLAVVVGAFSRRLDDEFGFISENSKFRITSLLPGPVELSRTTAHTSETLRTLILTPSPFTRGLPARHSPPPPRHLT